MIGFTKRLILKTVRSLGYDITPYGKNQLSGFPPDFNEEEMETIKQAQPYTMTGRANMFSFIHAVKNIVKNNVPGDIVECGVWKGGSMMVAARTLANLKISDRTLWLYDTYEGMTKPTEDDVSWHGEDADKTFKQLKTGDNSADWCHGPLEGVKQAVFSTGYDQAMFKFIKGPVEETIPDNLPKQIAILRLDTDFYESTKHELKHLYPLLSRGGILIIDDYGFWKGSRKAVDEYIRDNNLPIFLHRIDSTARLAIKL